MPKKRRHIEDEEEEDESPYIGPVKKFALVSKALMAVTAVLGVVLIYLYIAVQEAISFPDKILYAGILTICLALIFGGLYSMSQDTIRAHEREKRRKRSD